jgi:LmbE family N-acetylglucosaminyl deacetylase
MSDTIRLLNIGAHPDDCEFSAGGFAALTAARGGSVLHVSLTNGDKGHQTIGGAALARTRLAEAQEAAAVVGAEALVLDNHDGELMPTLENRSKLIGIIRDFKPDLLLCPRMYDYHPDHRYTAQLVQDSLYMVRVQNVCAHHQRLDSDPIVMYVHDIFRKPYPIQPDVVIDIDSVYDKKIEALGKHACQMFEWLPYVAWGVDVSDVPKDSAGRQSFLREQLGAYRFDAIADQFRSELISKYGSKHGSQIEHAEVFEWCELGAPLTDEGRARFFPF